MKKILLASLLSSMAILNTANAQVTNTFNASSQLDSLCTISVNNINFGNYDPLVAGEIFANGAITVLCSKSVAYSITPESGYGTGVFKNSVQLMRGTGENKDALSISLFKGNNGASGIWSGVQGSGIADETKGPINGVGTGSNASHPISAFIANNRGVTMWDATASNTTNKEASPDSYSVTVMALITY